MTYDLFTDTEPRVGRLIVGCGPREVEQIVLATVDNDRERLRVDPSLLLRPLKYQKLSLAWIALSRSLIRCCASSQESGR